MNAMLEQPDRWPLVLVLPLVHREKRGEDGLPVQGFLVRNHGPRVYLGNVCEAVGPRARTGVLNVVASCELSGDVVDYASFAGVDDVWRVD